MLATKKEILTIQDDAADERPVFHLIICLLEILEWADSDGGLDVSLSDNVERFGNICFSAYETSSDGFHANNSPAALGRHHGPCRRQANNHC